MEKLENFFKRDKNYKLSILFIFVLFFLLRSYHLNSPILDRHSWNQVSTASVALNISKNPSSFWAPDFNAIQSKNNSSIMAQEFPIFMGLIAFGYHVFGTYIWVARIIGILIGGIGWYFLFRLCRLTESRFTSLLILLIYTINSHNWFFDRAINSDTGMVSFMLVAFYFFTKYVEKGGTRNLILLTLTTTLAGLFKPFGLMIGVSFIIFLWRRKQLLKLIDFKLWIMGLIVWGVNLSWLVYTKYYLSNSIGIGHNLGFDLSVLFNWKYYYVLSQRFFDQILSPFLAFFFLFALFSKRIRSDIASALFAGNVFYLIFITHGNMVHNYYQLPLTPALCIYSGLGMVYWLQHSSKHFTYKFRQRLAIFMFIMFILYSGKRAWNHFRLAIGPKLIGDYVQTLNLPKETLMVAIEPSGTRYHEILYYSELKGFVVRNPRTDKIIKYKERGATIVGVHLKKSDFRNQEYMIAITRNLVELWSSTDCVDTYSKPCFIGVYRFR